MKKIITHVFSPIFFGGMIYILFRNKKLYLFNWLKLIGLNHNVDFLRNLASSLKNYFPNWVFFSLPDGLWIYSFTSAIIIWSKLTKMSSHFIIVPFFFGPISELLQKLMIIPGTFDIVDFIIYIVFFILSILLNFKSLPKGKIRSY